MSNLEARYSRNHQALSQDDQLKLASATVAVVGCGGLGGYIAEEMARLGVGHLILIDFDRFEVSNLNRQLMSTEHNLGEWKVEAAQARLKTINSSVNVTIYKEPFTKEKGKEMFKEADLVCDALDSVAARLDLESTCYDLGIPLVFAAIGGWYGILGVSFPGDWSIAKYYGEHKDKGLEKLMGNPAFTPAVLAGLSVAESIKLLLGRPVALRKSWLFVDLLTMEFQQIAIE